MENNAGYVSYDHLESNRHPFLTVHLCGREACVPSHSFGPFIRSHYLIHFILSGRGVFLKNGVRYGLSAEQGFLIVPGESTVYTADSKDPWEYIWFGFNGLEAQSLLSMVGLSAGTPIFSCLDADMAARHLMGIIESAAAREGREQRMLGYLHLFFSTIRVREESGSGISGQHAERAAEYMRLNFCYDIHVADVARHIGIDRSHLFRIFRAKYGSSVQQYLLGLRMAAACRMLSEGTWSINEVCFSCGFKDVNHFSKLFRQKTGIAPGKYRSGSRPGA